MPQTQLIWAIILNTENKKKMSLIISLPKTDMFKKCLLTVLYDMINDFSVKLLYTGKSINNTIKYHTSI